MQDIDFTAVVLVRHAPDDFIPFDAQIVKLLQYPVAAQHSRRRTPSRQTSGLQRADNGLFGPYLKDILLSGSVASQYKGEQEVGGQRLARYEYTIPLLISGQMIRTIEGSGKVGIHGATANRRPDRRCVLGDPTRRQILELLARGERNSGNLTGVIGKEFGITQAAVSLHLRILRESGFVRVRIEGRRRIYSIDSKPLTVLVAGIVTPFNRVLAPAS